MPRLARLSDFVDEILSQASEKFKRNNELKRLGDDLDRIAARVAEIFEREIGDIFLKVKQQKSVEAKSFFCYWAVCELGFSLTELARRLGISVAGVGYSVESGKIIAPENHYQLIN